jgi:hypothetical protein
MATTSTTVISAAPSVARNGGHQAAWPGGHHHPGQPHHNCWRGIWLDWMTQGTRVSGNLLHNNENTIPAPGDVTHGADLFLEVNHGPILVDHNVMLSPMALWVMSQGNAFAHNLFGGHVKIQPDVWSRQTPFLAVHFTAGAGMHPSPCGDDRYFHNLFLHPVDLAAQIDPLALPTTGAGNVYAPGSQPFAGDASPLVLAAAPTLNLTIKPERALLTLDLNADVTGGQSRAIVTSELLGSAAISSQRFENPDESALSLERDYFGKPRDPAALMPGPLPNPAAGQRANLTQVGRRARMHPARAGGTESAAANFPAHDARLNPQPHRLPSGGSSSVFYHGSA